MADVQDFIDEVRAKLLTLTPALAVQVTNSDYRDDMDDLAAGAAHYRLRTQEQANASDSNQTIQVAAMQLLISHRLADRFDERAYTEGNMIAHQAALLDKFWWRDLPAVREMVGAVELVDNVEREGNIISWTVQAIVAITPA